MLVEPWQERQRSVRVACKLCPWSVVKIVRFSFEKNFRRFESRHLQAIATVWQHFEASGLSNGIATLKSVSGHWTGQGVEGSRPSTKANIERLEPIW